VPQNTAELTRQAFSGTKDIRPESLFRSFVVRWLWRFYTQRLTQTGRWFLWVSLIFAAYGSTSFELQAYVPFSHAFGLWAVALVCTWLYRPRLIVNARIAERAAAGETMTADIEYRPAAGALPVGLRVLPHRLPPEIDVVATDGVELPAIARGDDRGRARVALRCNRRGVYALRGFRVESDFPFGMMRAHQTFADERRLIVYPKFTPLTRLTIPTGRRLQPGGVALAATVGDSFEFVGDREYREGDNVRDMDWRATARLGTPIVREYREEYFLRVAVILDTHVPPAKRKLLAPASVAGERGALRPESAAFERAVSVCAAVSDYMSRQEYLVDIFAAGPKLYHLTAGRGLAYLDQILDILACVDEHPEEGFDAIEPELMENLASISSVVCVFLNWTAARRAFVRRLHDHGVGLKVIVVRDGALIEDVAADSALFGGIPVIDKAAFDAGIEEL
jgi:uncharacterized protein (DUF58 family)